MLKNLLAALAFLLLPIAVAQADEAGVRQSIEARFGIKGADVAKTAYSGLYEVRIGDDLGYTDERVTYLLIGSLIDSKTRENVTETRKQKLSTIKFDDLPVDNAIKTVRGNGKSVLAVFADPNCAFCRRFEIELASMTDVTIYTFLYPILDPMNQGDSVRKAKAIWCSKDRSKAWFDFMLKGIAPVMAGNCDTAALQRNLDLGQRLVINGTPTSFVLSGQRIVGARSAEVRKAVEVSRN
jgi:thiol:disulfide interchange protein DsbC